MSNAGQRPSSKTESPHNGGLRSTENKGKVTHPKSAKAYFVQAQLYARQGRLSQGQASLTQAEKLSPGLDFAKPDSVRGLRAQLAAQAVTPNTAAPSVKRPVPVQSTTTGMSWGWIFLLGGGALLIAYMLFRRRDSAAAVQYGVGGQPLSGGGYGSAPGAAGYPGAYAGGQPGMGQRVMGGVATGLAVGAGVVAGEAIARNLMGDHRSSGSSSHSNNDFEPISSNDTGIADNFGISDTTSWDDAGSSDVGGGGDWDT